MFSFTFLCKFSCICDFAIFVRIFMKFSPKCRSKKLGMIYTILGSFCSFFNWKRADIRPKIWPRKIPVIRMPISATWTLFINQNLHEVMKEIYLQQRLPREKLASVKQNRKHTYMYYIGT